ncbi:MAG TPA: ferritin-like domain-containing protein [Bryobacteraceae bacterium]|nr:ferritin-like domain-containing protein [Bryobacteraceae bacterium]
MAKQVAGLEQLLVEELQDLFDAEKQLVRALPKMAKSATDEELETALRAHLEVTRNQVQRIEHVFESMDMRPRRRPCKGMKAIVEEGQDVMSKDRENTILDSAITGAARKVEHYEIAGYESVRSLAQQLGLRDAARLLQETLREEIEADRQLAQISRRLLKQNLAKSGQENEEGQGSGRGAQKRSASRRAGATARGRSASRRRAGSRTATARTSARRAAGASAHSLLDHDEIRRWAEERGATPACVKDTGWRGDIGIIRLDFPGYSGEESLESISWDDWFRKFDERGLTLIVQDTMASGRKSNFNKLVKRKTAEERPKVLSAR